LSPRPRNNRSKQRIFVYDGLKVAVATDDAADVDWLAEFLRPHFRVREHGVADCSVRLTQDGDQWKRLKRKGPHPDGARVESYFLDTRIVRHPVWKSAKSAKLVFDTELDVFYRLDESGRSVHIVAQSARRASRLALMRVVREFAMNHAHRPERLVVHGAALMHGPSGLLIPGHKGAGKTSLLIHALLQKQGRYVSNDRVVLYPDQDGFVAHGMPTLVKLRHSSLCLFPDLYERLKASHHYPALSLEESAKRTWGRIRAWRKGQYTLSPAQLCDLLKVPARARGPVAAVLFPRVSAGVKGVRLERLARPEAATRLEDSLFRARFSRKSGGMFSTRNGAPADDAVADRVGRVVARVPCYLCHLGLGAERQRSLSDELDKHL